MPANLRSFDQFVGETELSTRMLHRFIKSSERGLQSARDEEKAMLDAQAKEIKGEFIAVLGAFIDHHQAHGEEIPRILRYSHVIAIHSLFERQLDLLCKEVVSRKENLPILPEDLKGYPYVGAYRIFLTKVVDASISVWGDLDSLRHIRNCIAHGDGFVEGLDRGKSKLRSVIKRTDGLSETEDGRLQIGSEYIQQAFDTIFTFFEEAFENLGFGQGWPSSKFADECAIIIDEEEKTVRVISDDDEFEQFLDGEGD